MTIPFKTIVFNTIYLFRELSVSSFEIMMCVISARLIVVHVNMCIVQALWWTLVRSLGNKLVCVTTLTAVLLVLTVYLVTSLASFA